jgi:hypothetical protein
MPHFNSIPLLVCEIRRVRGRDVAGGSRALGLNEHLRLASTRPQRLAGRGSVEERVHPMSLFHWSRGSSPPMARGTYETRRSSGGGGVPLRSTASACLSRPIFCLWLFAFPCAVFCIVCRFFVSFCSRLSYVRPGNLQRPVRHVVKESASGKASTTGEAAGK